MIGSRAQTYVLVVLALVAQMAMARLPTSAPAARSVSRPDVSASVSQPDSLLLEQEEPQELFTRVITLGQSVQGRPIVAHQLGQGSIWRAMIGAIHGAYEWNTAALMTRTLDHLIANPADLPEEITLFIVPVANPDGYAAGRDTIAGRTNANRVDLNRNWDYKWQADAWFGKRPISGGNAPFSEPESVILRDFIMDSRISEVIFYHSAYPAVFAGAGVTNTQVVSLAQHIAEATGYPYRPGGIPGQIMTGNAIDWLTMNGVNAIEIELTNHSAIDWPQNLRGLRAFLKWRAPAN